MRNKSAGLALVVVIVTPSAVVPQEILEVDFAVGRIIMDDELRAMSNVVLAIDRERAVLYTEDREEPEAVMAFSLETGEWLRTIRTPTGGGPNEFPQGKTGIAMAPHGGLHVAGVLRVITFDSLGVPLSHWQPRVPTSRKVCDFAGVPAVPTQGGVVRWGPDGEDQGIGPNVVEGQVIATSVRAEALAISDRIWNSRIACSGDAAYVLWSYEGAPDSVSVYHLDGRESHLDVPAEYTDERAGCRRQTRNPAGRVIRDAPCPTWNQRLDLSFDDRGNVVLLGRDVATPGAIVDPGSGCYAVIRATNPDASLRATRIYRDSVLVLRRENEQENRNGRLVTMLYGAANRVSLHPLRRVNGEPCPGMLPSITTDIGE